MRYWINFSLTFICCSCAIGLFIFYGLVLRWDQHLTLIHWSPFKFYTHTALEIITLYGQCVALALLPGFFIAIIGCIPPKKNHLTGIKVLFTLGIASALLGVFYGALPIQKSDQINQLYELQVQRGKNIYPSLEHLREEGRYKEIVQTLERSLEIQADLNNIRGVFPSGYNHGFSYLFVTLYPAANDLPPYLGRNASVFLFDAWHDLPWDKQFLYEEDELAIELSHSKDRLLRAIAYWVLKDYVSFEKESIAGAEAGDRRMDCFALIAACLFSTDKKSALKSVKSILDRGIGLGAMQGPQYSSSNEILLILEGTASSKSLGGYYKNPPKKRPDKDG